MDQDKVRIESLMVQSEGRILLQDISFSVKNGEIWAITGPSGSGKTILGKVLAGLFAPSSGSVAFYPEKEARRILVPQQHDFRYLLEGRSYYQQRFDNNYGNEVPKVDEILIKVGKENGKSVTEIREIELALKLTDLKSRRLIELSNGEGKRLQIALALLKSPDIIVFDSPFIGLDIATREILNQLIQDLNQKGIGIFLLSAPQHLPSVVHKCIYLKDGRMEKIGTPDQISIKREVSQEIDIPEILKQSPDVEFEKAVFMKDVSVEIGGKPILKGINWEVLKGDKWALKGHNGAGKSTLLSLITADNPQSYQNEMYLFDRRRGTGESIWEIKSKIGYISPELHLYFQRMPNYTETISISSGNNELTGYSASSVYCYEAVASGFADQIGSSGKVSSYQDKQIKAWLELLGLKDATAQPLYKLPLGEQRLILLARALVKNPPLLILDEPCQGLDQDQITRFKKVVDAICAKLNKTLIYVSHYDDDIPECVDKVLVLENGKVVRS